MNNMKLINLQKISKTFYKEDKVELKVLSDISLSVKKGECFTIIGPNGSGKTTLLRILGLLENPTEGNIYFAGKDITNLSRKETVTFRRKFSFVRQKPLVLNTSVANNIAYGLKVRGLERGEILSKVKEILEFIGLKGLATIAMNFVLPSEIYLLDEVSANLDLRNVTLLDDLITKLKQDKEKTIILSTHDPLEAIKYADRIAVLNNGKISQINTPEIIFTSPKDEFTAQFVGFENIFSGLAEIEQETGLSLIKINDLTITSSTQIEGSVKVCIRPESIIISKDPPANVSTRNSFEGKIDQIRDLGNICHLIVACNFEKFLVSITKASLEKLNIKLNTALYINFKATDVKCL